MKGYYIASVSFGKDSLCMVHELLRRGYPLDEVVFFNTGMEFKSTLLERDRLLPVLKREGVRYTELSLEHDFTFYMFDRPVFGRNGFHYGYSWCGGVCRWGTYYKIKAMDRYAEERGATVYLGIAADEYRRLLRPRKEYKVTPLADWGITEQDALDYCYALGYEWRESGVWLYDLMKSVSCWCCTNKSKKELRNIYLYLPDYWRRLQDLQKRTDRPMKGFGNSVFDMEAKWSGTHNPQKRHSGDLVCNAPQGQVVTWTPASCGKHSA